jgi:hypothetical protein
MELLVSSKAKTLVNKKQIEDECYAIIHDKLAHSAAGSLILVQ